MSAPVLSTKQKNKTLSAKKLKKVVRRKPANAIRTILCNNTPVVKYQLSPEECIEFEKKMSAIFQYKPPILPKWSTLKDLSRKERKEIRSQLNRQQKHPSSCYLIFGINTIVKAIETKNISSLIMSNNISPMLFVRHIYEACEIYQIPLRVVNNFRKFAKKCFGFPCIALGFKKNIPCDDPVYEIEQFIKSFSPVPNTAQKIVQNDFLVENCNTNKDLVAKQQDEDEKVEHLERHDLSKRCFIPEVKVDEKCIQENLNFIKFNVVNDVLPDPGLCTKMKKKHKDNEVVFNNLKVKKIQGNKNRKNKKINKNR